MQKKKKKKEVSINIVMHVGYSLIIEAIVSNFDAKSREGIEKERERLYEVLLE